MWQTAPARSQTAWTRVYIPPTSSNPPSPPLITLLIVVADSDELKFVQTFGPRVFGKWRSCHIMMMSCYKTLQGKYDFSDGSQPQQREHSTSQQSFFSVCYPVSNYKNAQFLLPSCMLLLLPVTEIRISKRGILCPFQSPLSGAWRTKSRASHKSVPRGPIDF